MVASRGLVPYVVTEYGVAYLQGRSIRERAMVYRWPITLEETVGLRHLLLLLP